MDAFLWIVLLGLIVVLIGLQVMGVRALRDWGAEPSRLVVALRVLNVVLVIAVIAFAFWMWMRR